MVVRLSNTQAAVHKLLNQKLTNYIKDFAEFRDGVLMLKESRLVTTMGGRLGLVTKAAMSGDQVWMIEGCGAPVILRPMGDKFELAGLAQIACLKDTPEMKSCLECDFDTALKLG
jgi:hypothetical protein